MENQYLFTCVTCTSAFKDSEKQRAHYKSDWHRYNLKRKIADLAPVNAQAFAERVQLQKSQVINTKSKNDQEKI
jgi:pre-60S factor REI1